MSSSRQLKQKDNKPAQKRRKATINKDDELEDTALEASTSKPEIAERLSQNSTSTNDDELAQALFQKLQFGIPECSFCPLNHETSIKTPGLEKKQKEKETKFLAMHEKELNEIQTRSRAEFNECCNQIDEAYESFLLEYAKLEDHIRALWVKVGKTFEPYINLIEEQIRNEEQADNIRKKEQMRGLAYHERADEDLRKLIVALLEEHDP